MAHCQERWSNGIRRISKLKNLLNTPFLGRNTYLPEVVAVAAATLSHSPSSPPPSVCSLSRVAAAAAAGKECYPYYSEQF